MQPGGGLHPSQIKLVSSEIPVVEGKNPASTKCLSSGTIEPPPHLLVSWWSVSYIGQYFDIVVNTIPYKKGEVRDLLSALPA